MVGRQRSARRSPPVRVAKNPDSPQIDLTFLLSYIPSVAWEVEYTDNFESWWDILSEEEQVEIDRKVHLLQEPGPTLPRPHADVIVQSRHSNMKELRGKVEQRQLRVLYAFDPRRTAILLIGGDKNR
jgi:hypothetical protein